jgi:predicted nucleic acid-binding protein
MNGRAFLDASFWIAYRDERQNVHEQAVRALTEMFRRRMRFVTTLPVLCETHAHFCRKEKRKREIIQDFDNNPLVHIEGVSEADRQKAFELLQRHADKSYSLCDAISFVIMRRLDVKHVLCFDDHFRQFGEFEIIPDKFP